MPEVLYSIPAWLIALVLLLQAAERHALTLNELSEEALQEMQRRYLLKPADIRPRVYYRLTDNWLELTVRFLTMSHWAMVDCLPALSPKRPLKCLY